MAVRSIFRIQLLLVAAYFAVAAIVWPTLPERIPIHFDFIGNPTSWVPTSVLSWFGLPLLAAAITLFFYGSHRLALRTPELWNVPEKERFLALSKAERTSIQANLHRLLPWSAVLVTFTFIAVHLSIYETAIGRSSGQTWIAILLIFAPIAILIVLVVRISREAAKQIRKASPE